MTSTTLRSRSARGSVWFLAGSIAVHAGNYAFNVVVARRLTPAEYSDVALAITALLLAGFITVGLQMATARVVATDEANPVEASSLARWFSRVGFWAGAALGIVMLAALPALSRLFNTDSPAPIVGVAVALPFAFVTGVGRGWLQGSHRFGRLAVSFQAEMVVRLVVGVGAVMLGFGVAGAVGGLVASVAVAAGIGLPGPGSRAGLDPGRRRMLLAAVAPSLLVLVGEALVNHVDTVVAKSAFEPTIAGQFAGIALLGRTVFFVTWPVTMVVFPMVASAAGDGPRIARLVRLAAGGVGTVALVAAAAGFAAPQAIVRLALGAEFVSLGHLLGPYLVATGLFAVATTVISLRLASGDDRAGVVAVGAGLAVALTLGFVHPSPEAVVWTQVGLMAAFVAVVLAWSGRMVWGHR